MFRALRKHLTPSTAIAFVALVFAITGGAFAATGSGNNNNGGGGSHGTLTASVAKKKPKAKPKAKAGPRGPAGPKGATGPAGASGAQGPAGPSGGVGPAGGAGAPGSPGAPGQSVTGEAASAGECPSGGEKYTSASGTAPACNGKAGKEGKEGSPWTAGGVLPSGKTETGTWYLKAPVAGNFATALSFPIPLENEIPIANVHFFEAATAAEIPAGCTGTIVEELVTELKAEPGNFCVWVQFHLGEAMKAASLHASDVETGELGVGRSGVLLAANGATEGNEARGTWAVTAP